MSTAPSERYLAAIVTADVVGYSRLMGADERGTLSALKAHRSDLIDPLIAAHKGHIVKTTGDGSINGAGKLDQHEQSADVPPEVRIEFRIVESRSVSCDATITRLR